MADNAFGGKFRKVPPTLRQMVGGTFQWRYDRWWVALFRFVLAGRLWAEKWVPFIFRPIFLIRVRLGQKPGGGGLGKQGKKPGICLPVL
ncbi:hypothetical protein Pla100_47880 [Neorhodopirellula pilleata]|uniref:Uncharacterized protein n=1 Tax=Neorhodopirellula pilleata TaxID=2714738 RepID=A0A5C5ZYY1_9BACT|nr:hypothetical protein Pla100_47880 [Neorhodopirellula pilleata]